MNRKEAIYEVRKILLAKGLFIHGITWDFKVQWVRNFGDNKLKFDYDASTKIQNLIKDFKLTKQEIQ